MSLPETSPPVSPGHPSRRWQFGLGGLFLLMLLAAFALHPSFWQQLARWGVIPNTRHLITPRFEFEGATYLALTTAAGRLPSGVPSHLVLAFADKDMRQIVAVHLDPVTRGPVRVQKLGNFDDVILCDISGDGRPELLLDSTVVDFAVDDWQPLFPSRHYRLTDGSLAADVPDSIIKGGPGAVFALDDDVRPLFTVNHGGTHGVSATISSHSHSTVRTSKWSKDRWADAYGTGLPVLCRITEITKSTETQRETWTTLTYRAPDEQGNWQLRCYPERLPSLDDLAGILGRDAGPALSQ